MEVEGLVAATVGGALPADVAELAAAVARLGAIRAVARNVAALVAVVARHATAVAALTRSTALAATIAAAAASAAGRLVGAVAGQMAGAAAVVAARLLGRLAAVARNMAGTCFTMCVDVGEWRRLDNCFSAGRDLGTGAHEELHRWHPQSGC